MLGIGKDPWKKGHWTAEEDRRLIQMVHTYGDGQWNKLAHAAGLLRCGKSCRLRWVNYLRPGVKRGQISEAEESLIVQLHGIHGRRWSLIAAHLPGRSDNEIKNYWRSHIKKKLRDCFPPPQKQHKENEKNKRRGGSPKKAMIEHDFDYSKESSSSTPSSYSLNASIKPGIASDEDITSFYSLSSSSNSSSSFCYNGGDDLRSWLPSFPHDISWDIESCLNIACPYFNGHHDHCLHLWSNGLFLFP